MKITDLYERRTQHTTTMYHGTTSNNLREILKNGLRASPPKRVYDDGDYKTIGGVYITSDPETAIDYAQEATERFGGDVILIEVQYVKDSGYVDEDVLMQQISNALSYISHKNIIDSDKKQQIIYKYITQEKYFKVSEIDKNLLKDYAGVIADARKANAYAIHKDPNISQIRDRVLKKLRPASEVSELFVDRDIKFSGKTKIKKITNIDTSQIIYPRREQATKYIIAYDFDNGVTYALEVEGNADVKQFIDSLERSKNARIDDYKTVYAHDKKTKEKLASTVINTDDFNIIGNRIVLD